MGTSELLIGVGLGTVAVSVLGLLMYRWQRGRSRRLEIAREAFHRRREWLEADFLKRAGESGKPRGLEWVDCDFADAVTFARDRTNGQLRALVAVTIRFAAVAGGGMEHVEAVGNLRSATAVFFFDGRQWDTDGRAIFNLNPHETIEHFQHELEQA